jgi:hypothetical protein
MSSVDECADRIVEYVTVTRHDDRVTDDGVAAGVRDLIDDLLAEDQIGVE